MKESILLNTPCPEALIQLVGVMFQYMRHLICSDAYAVQYFFILPMRNMGVIPTEDLLIISALRGHLGRLRRKHPNRRVFGYVLLDHLSFFPERSVLPLHTSCSNADRASS